MKVFSSLLLGLCGLLIIMDITLLITGVSFINELDEFEGHPGGRQRGGHRQRGGGRGLRHEGSDDESDDDDDYQFMSGDELMEFQGNGVGMLK